MMWFVRNVSLTSTMSRKSYTASVLARPIYSEGYCALWGVNVPFDCDKKLLMHPS